MTPTEDKFYRATVIERTDFAPDLWSIRVQPETRFVFAPGQYATLGVQTEAKRIERAYSIVSSPLEKDLEFFFELVPQGELTPLLYKLHKGDQLSMRKVAKGRFTLDTQSGRTNHLLICTVTGIAPFISYIRTLLRSGGEQLPAGHHLYLLGGASRSWEFGYHEEVERAASEAPWLTFIATVSRPWEDAKWKGETGRVDDVIRKYADTWGLRANNTTAYLCGHPEMIEHGKGILKRIGFSKENTKEEVYWIPPKKAGP
jgi:ferredoxin--NADP+ reductase